MAINKMKKFRIVRIDEEDFGCEGRPEGEETMVSVILEDETGEKERVRVEDAYLYKLDINEGDWVYLDDSGKIQKIFPPEFPVWILKFAEEKQYLESLLEGNIYFKESGYFRKLEDNYRGDRNDGKVPLEIQPDMEFYLESEDGERLDFTGMVPEIRLGYEGDDKVPLFCASIVDERIIEWTGKKSFHFKKEFADELSQFGKYVAIIPIGEMYEKLKIYQKKHEKITFVQGEVKYVDIKKVYDDSVLDKWENAAEYYKVFFNKDLRYQWQNEWRVIMHSPEMLISDKEDSVTIDVGKFEYGILTETDMICNGEVHWE